MLKLIKMHKFRERLISGGSRRWRRLKKYFRVQYFDPNKSILIYTRGKVGTKTIEASIATDAGLPVFTSHCLSAKRIEQINAYWKSKTGKPHPESVYNKLLRREILKNIKAGRKLNVITAVRDSISTHLSGFFHNAGTLHPEIYEFSGGGKSLK